MPASPSTGVTHFATYVKEETSNYSYSNANIKFTALRKGKDSPKIGPVPMVNTIKDPTFYEFNTALNYEGKWLVLIEISMETGDASAVFEIDVTKPNLITPILFFLVSALFLFIMIKSLRSLIQEYRNRKNL